MAMMKAHNIQFTSDIELPINAGVVLTDKFDNSKWRLVVYNGKIKLDPHCDVAKRKHKINIITNED